MKRLFVDWNRANDGIVLSAGAEHSRGLQGTVRLALHSLKSHALQAECTQLLALLALCPPVHTPWSLFDGGDAEQGALMTRGRRVVVAGRSLGHVSVVERSCRIPKLKLEGVAVSGQVKEGAKVSVRLKDGKVVNVRGSDLLFDVDAAAVEVEGQWMLPRVVGSETEGRVLQQHADGSVSVLFQGPHEGCHVQLRGLTARADLNGCFGYVCGGCDGATQRWRVRVTLASGEVEDVVLEADCIACTGCVMAREDDGSARAVPAFASGWLTAQRPGAHVMRLREEFVKGVGVEGLLAAVSDDLAAVAAGVSSSGLVEVNGRGGCSACTSCCRRLCGRRLGTHMTASWLHCLKRAAAAWAMSSRWTIACMA